MRFKRNTKIIHLFLAITVVLQLLSQIWMFVPSPDKQPESQLEAWLFVIHLIVGLLVFCFVAVRLLSVIEDEDESKKLYPWTNREYAAKLWLEIKTVRFGQGALPAERDSSIAGTVHGLGLLLVLSLGLSGILFYMGLAPDGAMDMITTFFRSGHEFLAIFLWFFLIGHVGMFVHHSLKGKHNIREIFTFDADK